MTRSIFLDIFFFLRLIKHLIDNSFNVTSYVNIVRTHFEKKMKVHIVKDQVTALFKGTIFEKNNMDHFDAH